jgi:hypothetical protein
MGKTTDGPGLAIEDFREGISPSNDNRIYKGWIHFTVYYIMGNPIVGPSKGAVVEVFFSAPRFLIGTKRDITTKVM